MCTLSGTQTGTYMSILSRLFPQPQSELFSNEELFEAHACPNCWGEQEYDDQARKLINDKQIAVNNHESRHAFIQDFVVNHVSGIHLQQKGNTFTCVGCKKSYTVES